MTIRSFIAFGLLCAAAPVANAQAEAAPATGAAPSAPAPAAALPPTPSSATTVKLSLNEPLSSKTARTGQKFALTVNQDVLVNGSVLVPKGAIASGTVLFARKKGGGGRSGALDLRVDYVDTPAGRIRLKAAQNRRSEYLAGQAVVVGALLGILGTLAMQGDEIEIGAGLEFNAEIASAPVPVAVATAPVESALPAAPTDSAPAAATIETGPAADALPAADAPATETTLPATAAPTTSAPASPEN